MFKVSPQTWLPVNFGDHRRTILVGIRSNRPNPKVEMEERQALFVVNVPVRTVAYKKLERMMFDIGLSDGIVPVRYGAHAG